MFGNFKGLLIGSKHLGLEVLKLLWQLDPESLIGVATIDDSRDVRSALPQWRAFATSNALTLEVIQPSDLATLLIRLKPDFVLVVGWYRLLSQEILNLPPLGFFGIHASLLPAYRGGAPLVWQIINGESELGVSLFKIDNGMDTGPIVDQRCWPLKPDDYIADALVSATNLSLEMFRDNYARIKSGEICWQTQAGDQVSYASARRPEDGGLVWSGKSEQIYNFIRAQSDPYPGAFAWRNGGSKVIIWRARVFPMAYFGSPGRIDFSFDGGMVVACGEGAIIVDEVEIEGTRSPATDILRFGETLT